jgi:hypothetical protein
MFRPRLTKYCRGRIPGACVDAYMPAQELHGMFNKGVIVNVGYILILYIRRPICGMRPDV